MNVVSAQCTEECYVHILNFKIMIERNVAAPNMLSTCCILWQNGSVLCECTKSSLGDDKNDWAATSEWMAYVYEPGPPKHTQPSNGGWSSTVKMEFNHVINRQNR